MKAKGRWFQRMPGTEEGWKYMECTIITNGCDCHPWHEVRAWLPVKTITGQRVWGKNVFKRRVWVVWGTGFHMEPETQYATAFELLTYEEKTTVNR